MFASLALKISSLLSFFYTTKKTCDIVTKVCDTLIELKWQLVTIASLLTISVCFLCVLGIYYLRAKIKKE
jgi:hypothetical protein